MSAALPFALSFAVTLAPFVALIAYRELKWLTPRNRDLMRRLADFEAKAGLDA